LIGYAKKSQQQYLNLMKTVKPEREKRACTMDEHLSRYVPLNWVKQSNEAIRRREKLRDQLIETGNLPNKGWDEQTIEWFIQELSLRDSNNFLNNVGAGEREGRVFSSLVQRRNLDLSHGIGRSGDVVAVQPKACGSSIIAKLTQSMVLDLLRRVLSMRSIKKAIVLPTATGLTITLTLLALQRQLASQKLDSSSNSKIIPRYVIWPRMDQKTCLKSIVSSGFIPVIVENQLRGDSVQADVDAIRKIMEESVPGTIACVLTTTSCFAPRVPDDVENIAKLCKEFSIAHVINNSYGLQCNKCVHSVESACRLGRVDAIIQSTDKNFMVPVGGAVVASPNADFLDLISQTYPGRASMSPILDLFITMLEMGKEGYERLRKERIDLVQGPFRDMLVRVAEKNGQRLLISQRNTISFAISLTEPVEAPSEENVVFERKDVTSFGSMLFTRGVSGARVVKRLNEEKVAGISFVGYGSSLPNYPCSYFSVACALGAQFKDIALLEERLNETFAAWNKKAIQVQKPVEALEVTSDPQLQSKFQEVVDEEEAESGTEAEADD
jgi:O-phospho-L-seryl-tRNASec:L-selenocysteinyl-tRNA synthase